MQELAQALRKTGTEVVLSGKGSFATGDFNLYAADNIGNLPEVADRNAINVLWLPMVQGSDDAARLRPFDVVVVKSMAAFGHLKAINVRTAYIPDAINIKIRQTAGQTARQCFTATTGDFRCRFIWRDVLI